MDCAALWCVVAHICAPLCVVAAVNDHKANTILTELFLASNGVGNAGAIALADALQATVLTCEQWLSMHVPAVATDVPSQSGVNIYRRQLVVQFVLLLLCFFSFVLE